MHVGALKPALSSDRRQGGRWGIGQATKNHLLYFAASALLGALSLVSSRQLPRLGRGLGRALYRLGLARDLTLRNLAQVYPDLDRAGRDALGLRVYAELGTYLGEAVARLHRPAELVPIRFEEGSRAILEEAVGEGRGVVFASAHLGPWETVAGSLVHHGFPLTTLARESYDPRFVRLYDRLRGSAGVQTIYRGSAAAPLQIVRALRRGVLLGVPMDLRSRVPSIPVPFLGIPAETAIGPARIALRTGAPVVVGTAVPGESGELQLRMTRIPSGDLGRGDAGEQALTRRINDELSRRILAFPQGWVWMHPRWTDASGSEAVAAAPGPARSDVEGDSRGPFRWSEDNSAPSPQETR